MEQNILGLYIYTNAIILKDNVMLEFGDNEADTSIFRISKISFFFDHMNMNS